MTLTEAATDRIEALQAAIRQETGRSVTQRELLERIVSETSRETPIDAYRDEFEGLDEADRARALGNTSDWGVRTTEDEIDDLVVRPDSIDGDDVDP